MSKFYTSLKTVILTLFLCAAVFLWVAAPGLAYQSTEPPRDGMTQLNLSQTIKGITVTVDSIYIDDQTIRLHYEIVGDKEAVVKLAAKGDARLYDHQGNHFSPQGLSKGFATTADGKYKAVFDLTYQTQAYYRPGQMFNQPRIRYEAQGEIDLIFELTIDNLFVLNSVSAESTQEVTPMTPTPGITATPEPLVFHFEFRVPFYSSTIIEPNQTVTVNDLAVTLQRVEISPNVIVLFVCYDLDESSGWNLEKPALQIDNQTLSFSMYNSYGTCDQLNYDFLYDGTPTTLTFEIPYFQNMAFSPYSVTQAQWDQIKPLVEAKGIKIDYVFDANGYVTNITNISAPADVDVWAIIGETLYEDGFIDRIDGPWKFTVEINALDQ
jgi:hypothetical protein